jgi:hypothetical protein
MVAVAKDCLELLRCAAPGRLFLRGPSYWVLASDVEGTCHCPPLMLHRQFSDQYCWATLSDSPPPSSERVVEAHCRHQPCPYCTGQVASTDVNVRPSDAVTLTNSADRYAVTRDLQAGIRAQSHGAQSITVRARYHTPSSYSVRRAPSTLGKPVSLQHRRIQRHHANE